MLEAVNLKCEYLKNPVGMDALKPRFSWVAASDGNDVKQATYRIQVSAEDTLFANPDWDSGTVASDNSVHVVYEGLQLKPRTRYYIRVKISDSKGTCSSWSEAAFFETAMLDTKEWKAQYITAEGEDSGKSSAGTLMRKSFQVGGTVASARIYATSLGLYEIMLNGKRVGEQYLAPGWTSYSKRLQYQTYDVTALLKTGDNALGAIVGCGWFKGDLVWEKNRNLYGSKTALLAQMHIKYTDGSEQVVVSDHSWKCEQSPILMSEIYHGETYDARLEITGWSDPEFDDMGWKPVSEVEWDKKGLIAQENEPVRKIEEIQPVDVLTTPKGEAVLDFGQNMVGWVRFKVSGPAGSKVILKHAEVLDKEGNFYTANLRQAKQTVEYILKGQGMECYEPHFTFQGFRYVQIVEFPGQAEKDNFTGIVLHSDMERTGDFSCSNEMVNQLQHNIVWGLKGNFVDVPTDCPQRNERLGWTGDAQVFAATACYIMNAAPFFTKWLKDLAVDQLENGGVPFVIPNVLDANSHSSSGWGDAAVICPWTVYVSYGDERILEQQYASMKGWVEYIRSKAENGLIWNSGFHFGDWLGLDAKEGSCIGATCTDMISTAFYAYSTELVAKAARVLHKQDEYEKYNALHGNIVDAFRKEFYTATGRLAVPTQTAHVLALMFHLVDEKDKQRTVDDLVKYIEANNWHLATGFLGTPYLCHVLSSNGRADVAYRLLLQTDYPSWLYPITKGATTIWEHWDSMKPDGTFWSTEMNSFNHYAYGAVGEWLYRVVAGIATDEAKPGYKHSIMRPQPGGGVTWARASLASMYGKISMDWRIENGVMHMEVEIPHNTTASLTLPAAGNDVEGAILPIIADDSSVCGNPSTAAPYAKLELSQALMTENGLTVELGSGRYSFTYSYHGV